MPCRELDLHLAAMVGSEGSHHFSEVNCILLSDPKITMYSALLNLIINLSDSALKYEHTNRA